ncbi:MAG TPA: 50S ribosomal protein L10 [Saprospiraceae bacterium]|nr:50S ribosomal protein L10 [Saprospiraceae bacterium]HMQ84063.1 50S ribosomal protein L10 [Saprospiraceae bacterium]
MTKVEKTATIEELKEKLSDVQFFYLTDSSTLTVEKINAFRRICFEKGIEVRVVKNTLLRKALESFPEERRYDNLYEVLQGPTSVLFTENANLPAKILKEFRKENDKPVLKAAYIDSDVFLGDDQLDALATLKSKEDLLGEVVTLLLSPMQQLVGALQSGGNTISGLLKTLEERGE